MVKCFVLTITLSMFMITVIPGVVHSDTLDPEIIWSLISEGKCSEARQKVEQSPEVGQYLSSPYGKVLYAKSLCCSPSSELTVGDISNAVTYIDSARSSFDPLPASTAQWLNDAIKQCAETRLSVDDKDNLDTGEMLAAKKDTIKIASGYQGKIMSGCKDKNLSPILVPAGSSKNNVDWHYVVLNPGADSQRLMPTDEYLQTLVKNYVGGKPKVSVCAPYIALSDSQDPENICKDAIRFTDYFLNQYNSKRPPTWVSLYHYPQQSKRLYEHAKNTTGDIQCNGVLGYYDWRRQSVIFEAPSDLFGTFHHELTHALLFWDIPLAPRWFEESVAALYENTDGEYMSLENYWRERVLEKSNVYNIDIDVLRDRALGVSVLEFEHSPVPATIAREYMRKLQRCGDLPSLYKVMRDRYRLREQLAEGQTEPHRSPSKSTVDSWSQILDRYDKRDTAPPGCS